MKKLIKIFLTILPALYLNNAMGDDANNTFTITGTISPENTPIQIKLDSESGCKFRQSKSELLANKYIQNTFTETVVCPKTVKQVTYTLTPGSPRTHKLTGRSTDKLKNTNGENYDLGTIKLRAIDAKTAAASPTNTPKSSKNTLKKTSSNQKNKMEENALKDFCEPVGLNGTQNYGHFDDDCTSTKPNIKIICYEKKNIQNSATIEKRYNNYCFSNKENTVIIDEFQERACTSAEADALNAKSCKTNDDGKHFYNITCKNTNDIVDTGTSKCISFNKQQDFKFQIENSTKNGDIKINLHITGLGAEYNTCRSSTDTITSPSTNITVECTKRIYFQITAKPVDSIESIGGKSGNYLDVTDTTKTPIVIKLKSSSNKNAKDQAADEANKEDAKGADEANKEDAKGAPVVVTPVETEPKWKKEEIDAARDAAESARETENSDVNKILGATGMGATGIGGMMLMQGLAEKAADDDATRAMQAYIATFNCEVGNNRVPGGATTEVPGGNELINLYGEYVNLANNVKEMKSELGLRPGIESEPILNSATSGLYDDVSVAGTSGAYASLARALMDPYGKDAAAWAEQTEKTSKNITTGAITAGTGTGVSLIGDLTNKAVEKKKAEKSEKEKKKKDREEAE